MKIFLTYAFLFSIGSVAGWVLELFFRRFVSNANPERRWINPGFCAGPYLPLYGTGLCLLYGIASLEKLNFIPHPVWNRIILFLVMAVCMTVIEYIAGFACLHISHVRLWDYSGEWGNIQGIICPKFSLFWAILGAAYYFLIHPYAVIAVAWLTEHPTVYFAEGLFFGVFIVDVVHSAELVAKLKHVADEYKVVVRYEEFKAHIRSRVEDEAKRIKGRRRRYVFFAPFRTERPLTDHIREWVATVAAKRKQKR